MTPTSNTTLTPILYLLISFYNESSNLARAHQSVLSALVNTTVRAVFVDGAYPNTNSPTPISTDSSQDYALSNGLYIPLSASETDKHNAGLHLIDSHASHGDYILMLDADEEIDGLDEIADMSHRVGIIDFYRESDNENYPRARIFAYSPHLHFITRHDLVDTHGNPVANLTDGDDSFEAGWGLHHDVISADRAQAKSSFYRDLQQSESDTHTVPTQGASAWQKV